MNFFDKVIPGMASRFSQWMFRNNFFPWVPVDIQLIGFGSGAAVLKLKWKNGVKVLRIYRKSLGKLPTGILETAEYYQKNYKTLQHWYGGPMDLVLPMEFLVLQGLPFVGPVAASIQPYVQAEKRDIFKDFTDTDFVRLIEANPFLRAQFLFFVVRTLRQWEEGKICYDFVGRENLMLVKEGGRYQLKIVDTGFFRFDRPEHSFPGKVAQIEQHMQRLTHLYQLAKSASAEAR